MHMNLRNAILIICSIICIQAAVAEGLLLPKTDSRVVYKLTCLGIPFKKKPLPSVAKFEIDKHSDIEGTFKLKRIDLTTYFTSRNPLFRKVINYKKYPTFTFKSHLKDYITVQDKKDFIIEGVLNFHGTAKEVRINLTPEFQENRILFTGYYGIKMTEFGLKPPRLALAFIDDEIQTKIEVYYNFPED